MSQAPHGFQASDVALHSEWMRRLARALVADASTADDVVQDAWTKVGGAPGTAYMAAVVRSLARRWLRSERRRAIRERAVASDEALPSTAEIAARSELAHALAEAVERLEEPYRTTIVLRYYDDLSSADIARRAGIPAATVRARLKRGLDVLRARLDQREGGRERWVSALLPWTRGPSGPTATLATTLLALGAMKIAVASLLVVGALVFLWRTVAVEPASPRSTTLAAREAHSTRAEDGAKLSSPEGPQSSAREERQLSPAPASPAASASGDRVRARVVDELEMPLPNAWLRLRDVPETYAAGDGAGQVELRMEAAELERLAALDDDRVVDVEVGAAGQRTRLLRAYLPEGCTLLELGDVRLEPGGAVYGRVLDEWGLPVEGALVVYGTPIESESFAEYAPYNGPPDLQPQPWKSGELAQLGASGPRGEFRLEGVPAGHGRVWARTDTTLWGFSPPIGVRRGEEMGGIELVLREAPDEVLTGRVVDPDGRPLAGLELWFGKSGTDGYAPGRTDASGEFYFATRWTAVDIGAQAPSWEWNDALVPGVQPGTHGLVVAFERSRWLHVAVLDAGGQPVRDGHLVGFPESGPMGEEEALWRCESTLDASGLARIRRPNVPLRLRLEAPGYRTQILGPLDPELFPEPLTVHLEEAPALTGRVLRSDGRPAAGAHVSLHRGADSGGRAPDTPAGIYTHLTHQGWSGDRDAFVHSVRVDSVASVTADAEGGFRLPLPGVKTEEAGETEEGLAALGYANDPRRELRTAKSDAIWYVHAELAGEATITSGPLLFDSNVPTPLELRLPRGGAIAGRLVLADGVSPAGWTAWASDGLAEVTSAPVSPDGTFALANLHPGGWQVRVFEPGRRFHPDGGRIVTERMPVPDVEVVAGETVAYRHDAHVRTRARLAGQLSIDGTVPGPAWVVVETSTPQASITSYETTLDPDGRFELALEPDLSTSILVTIPRGGAQLTLSAKPLIVPGDNDWSANLQTALLEGLVAHDRDDDDPRKQMVYVVERGDVRAQVTWNLGEGGRFGPIVVPEGHGLLRGPGNGWVPGAVVAELDLVAGETRRIEPQPR